MIKFNESIKNKLDFFLKTKKYRILYFTGRAVAEKEQS